MFVQESFVLLRLSAVTQKVRCASPSVSNGFRSSDFKRFSADFVNCGKLQIKTIDLCSSTVVWHLARPTDSMRHQSVLRSRRISGSIPNKLQLASMCPLRNCWLSSTGFLFNYFTPYGFWCSVVSVCRFPRQTLCRLWRSVKKSGFGTSDLRFRTCIRLRARVCMFPSLHQRWIETVWTLLWHGVIFGTDEFRF